MPSFVLLKQNTTLIWSSRSMSFLRSKSVQNQSVSILSSIMKRAVGLRPNAFLLYIAKFMHLPTVDRLLVWSELEAKFIVKQFTSIL